MDLLQTSRRLAAEIYLNISAAACWKGWKHDDSLIEVYLQTGHHSHGPLTLKDVRAPEAKNSYGSPIGRNVRAPETEEVQPNTESPKTLHD